MHLAHRFQNSFCFYSGTWVLSFLLLWEFQWENGHHLRPLRVLLPWSFTLPSSLLFWRHPLRVMLDWRLKSLPRRVMRKSGTSLFPFKVLRTHRSLWCRLSTTKAIKTMKLHSGCSLVCLITQPLWHMAIWPNMAHMAIYGHMAIGPYHDFWPFSH